MLSTLPKLADKNFILGFFMPVLLACVAFAWLFADVPAISKTVEALAKKDTIEQLTYFLLATWGLAILLQIVNLPLFQLLEGYRWPISAMRGLKSRAERRFTDMKREFDTLNSELKQAETDGTEFPQDKENRLYELRYELVTTFPSRLEDLLPTRFGNAIRAFEVYSRDMYGADAIPMWLRLAAVVSKEFQEAIEDARAQVNFLVNLGFLAALFALLSFARFVFGVVLAGDRRAWLYLLCTAAAIALSRLMYVWSIERAQAWGELVKSAFDCYLPALAKQLGYGLPQTLDERTEFWTAVSRAAIYNRPIRPEQWPPAEAPKNGGDAKAAESSLEDVMRRLRNARR